MIGEEIHDAEKYARCALSNKDEYPSLAELFVRLSDEEMQHMNLLHEKTVEMIEKYRREKGEPPAAMMAVYNYLHEKHIDEAADVKRLRAMYR